MRLRVGSFGRGVLCYGAGLTAILAGATAAVLWGITLPATEVVIGDTVGFATGNALEAHGGHLSPWRPATLAEVQGDFRKVEPTVSPFSRPDSASTRKTQVKTCPCVSRSIRRRLRLMVEWSGVPSVNW